MRPCTALFLICLASQLSSQSMIAFNWESHGASRSGLGAGPGELLTGFHRSHWRAVGDTGAGCHIVWLSCWIQGQRSVFPASTFHWVVRRGTDAKGPATGAAGLLHRIGPTRIPLGGTAWLMITTLSVPASIPCGQHVSFGVQLPPSTARENLLVHTASPNPAEQHANADDISWQIVGGATTATRPGGKRSWRILVSIDRPTVQVLVETATGPRQSVGGMFPAVGSQLVAMVTGIAGAKFSGLYAALDTQASGVPILSGTGRLHLGPTSFSLLHSARTVSGVAAFHRLGVIPGITPRTKVWLQALTVGSRVDLSNAVAVTLDR